ncbi:MAG: class I SAM-dependent methyltransferase [Patescibacteria group bacterium]
MSTLIRLGQLSIIIIGIAWISFLVYELIQGRNRAPFIPSSRKAIRVILDNIPLPTHGIIVDLGAGDGKFLRAVKRHAPKLTSLGYEISPLALLLAKIKNILSRTPMNVLKQDMFSANLSEASLVFCFLLPHDLKRLEHKLQTELKPGTRVVSNTFSFPTWHPELELPPNKTGLHGFIRVYVVN